jgi:hypothetical protein
MTASSITAALGCVGIVELGAACFRQILGVLSTGFVEENCPPFGAFVAFSLAKVCDKGHIYTA